MADRYVIDNLRITLSLGEAELESAFASMEHPFVGQLLSDVREEFREWVIGVEAVKHREKLLEELSARCRVWIFFSPGAMEV